MLVNPESWALESRIQLKESGIPLKIGIHNPSPTDKDWNPVPGIRNARLSWIPLQVQMLMPIDDIILVCAEPRQIKNERNFSLSKRKTRRQGLNLSSTDPLY